MQRKKVLLCLAAAAFSMQFAACSGKRSNDSSEQTIYYSVSIDGDYTYYQEDNADVKSLNSISENFIYEIINRDYKTAQPENEYPYYTKAVRENYESMNRAENQKASLQAYELSTVLNQMTISKIEFYTLNGVPSASVEAEFISTIDHSAQAYLDSLGVKANTKYKRTITLSYVLEDNEWKILKYSATVREEVK